MRAHIAQIDEAVHGSQKMVYWHIPFERVLITQRASVHPRSPIIERRLAAIMAVNQRQNVVATAELCNRNGHKQTFEQRFSPSCSLFCDGGSSELV